jgi:biopolymer transport protein ExbD
MVTCASLVGGPECRDVTMRQWGPAPNPTFRDVVAVCGREYCPRLADAATLSVCQLERGERSYDVADAWVSLRQSMLLHDFPEAELPDAARALLTSTEYLRSVPPPVADVTSASPAELEVHLTPDGALAVRRGDAAPEPVASVAELAAAIPKPAGGARAVVRAGSDVSHSRVIAVLDVLRSLGYENVSFAVR